MAEYNLSGIPSDLLNSPIPNARRLKVEATLVDALADNGLIEKTFTYNVDGTIATKTEKNLTTLVETQFTYTWTNGELTNITPIIL